MLVGRVNPGTRLALLCVLASLVLLSGWAPSTHAQSPGITITDPTKLEGGGGNEGDPDGPDELPPPPTGGGGETTGDAGGIMRTNGSYSSDVEPGSVGATSLPKRGGLWAHWKFVLKFLLQRGFYVP